MPDPRIVIAVESANAEKNLSAVERGMREINAEAEKNSVRSALDDVNSRLRAAAAELDRAEAAYKSMQEGMAAGWSYTKDQIDSITGSFQKSQANFRALKDEQSSLRGRMTELSAAGEGTSAAINSAASGTQKLASKTDTASKSTQKLTAKLLAANVAARAFGLSVSHGLNFSGPLLAIGLAVKAMNNLKAVAGEAWGMLKDRFGKESSDRLAGLMATDRLIASRREFRRETFGSAFSVIDRLNRKSGPLDEADRLELSNAMTELKMDFSTLGIQVDKTTGKFVDAANAIGKIKGEDLNNDRDELLKRRAAMAKEAVKLYEMARNGAVFNTKTGELEANRGWRRNFNFIGDILRINDTKGWFDKADNLVAKIEDEITPRLKQIDRELLRIPGQISVHRKRIEIAEQKASAARIISENRIAIRNAENAQDTVRRALERQSGEMFKFRATTQGGVEAGSMAALELQSRRLLNPAAPGSGGPAVQTANGVQQMVVQGQAILQKLDAALTTLRANTAAAQKVANGISGARALW